MDYETLETNGIRPVPTIGGENLDVFLTEFFFSEQNLKCFPSPLPTHQINMQQEARARGVDAGI